MNDYTDEQVAEARAIVAAADEKSRAEAEAKRAAYIAPVTDLVTSAAYKEVYAAIEKMRTTYATDDRFHIHVGGLGDIMPRLANEIGVVLEVPAEDEPETEEPESEPEA